MGQKSAFLVTNLVRAVSLDPLGVRRSYFYTRYMLGQDVPFRGFVNFGLGGSIFRAKNYIFGNKSCKRRISGTA